MINKENKIDDLVNSNSLENNTTEEITKSQNEMEEELKNLKESFDKIIIENNNKIHLENRKGKEKINKKELDSMENHIIALNKKLIEKYDLTFNEEDYNDINFFIYEVERIIRDLEKS